jgi:hypothetical protein
MCSPKNKWIVAWLILSTAIAFGLPQGKDSRCSVTGRVINAVTGDPIVHAHVSFSRDRQTYGALTGADGRYSIDRLPSGEYCFFVDALGFRSLTYRDMHMEHLVLQTQEHKNDFDFSLIPFGSISGRVMDIEGRPVQGATVSALSIEGMLVGEQSDPDGQYRLGELPPGKYRVQAALSSLKNLPPEIRTDGTAEVNYAPTYYPSTLSMESAERLDVSPGDELTGIDILLVRSPILAVRGVVSGIPDGKDKFDVGITFDKVEARHIQVTRRPDLEGTGRFRLAHRVNPDGSFVIWRLDPGTYVLVARSNSTGLASPPVEITVEDKDIEGILLHLAQP